MSSPDQSTASEVSWNEDVSPPVAPLPTRGTKTEAVKTAMRQYPTKTRGEITELLRSQGWDITPQQISVIKSNMFAGLRRAKPAATAANSAKPAATKPAATAADSAKPASPAPAQVATRSPDLSFATLRRAKELANELGGIQEAQRTLDALSQLIG